MWTFQQKTVDELPEDVVGFVYQITNLTNGRMYIGKKLARFKRSRPPLKGRKNKRRYKVDSDWRDYYGSSDELSLDIKKIGKQNFIWSSPKSKNVNYKVEHPVFSSDENGRPEISYIDQFPEPKNMEQGNFLQRLSDALEESKNKITLKLPKGYSIVGNNHFWLHGRQPFLENKKLFRELVRIRGKF